MEYIKELSGHSSWYKKLLYRYNEARKKKQKTYILPTKFGLVYGVLCFVLLLMGMAYGNNLVYVVCFYLTTMGLALAKKTNDQISNVHIEDVFAKDIFAGEAQTLFVSLRNKTNQTLKQIEVRINKDSNIVSVDIKPQDTLIVELLWQPDSRGWKSIPDVRVQSAYPAGLFGAWKLFKPKKQVLVFARRNGLHNFPESSFTAADSIGVLKEIRDYVPGDSPKRIHWRSLAKNAQLRTLIHEGSEGQTCNLSLQHVSHLPLEQQVEQLTLWLSLANSQNVAWALNINDREFRSDHSQGPNEALRFLALWKLS